MEIIREYPASVPRNDIDNRLNACLVPPPEIISRIIGEETGWLGMLGVAVVGAITLIPGFVAFLS